MYNHISYSHYFDLWCCHNHCQDHCEHPDQDWSTSDGWATDDLVYKWKDVDPVQIVPGLHLPRLPPSINWQDRNHHLSRFTLEQYKSAYCNVITNTGEKCHQNQNSEFAPGIWPTAIVSIGPCIWIVFFTLLKKSKNLWSSLCEMKTLVGCIVPLEFTVPSPIFKDD